MRELVSDDKLPAVLATAAAIVGSLIARHAFKKTWRWFRDEPALVNPHRDGVSWPQAMIFGLITGRLVGVTRVASRDIATRGYRHFLNR